MDFVKKIINIICKKQILGTFIVILIAYILGRVLNRFISKMLVSNQKTFEVKRRKTIIKLIQSIIKFIIYSLAFLIILDFFGIDTKSLITSLGVLGLVLGLALQDTVRDLLEEYL